MVSAIGLSLLMLQFTFPPLFIVMIWLVPVVFGTGAARLPARVTLMVCLWTVVVAGVMLGFSTGLWALAYALHGTLSGCMLKRRVWLPVRLIISTAAFVALAVAFVWLIGFLAGISWHDITTSLDNITTRIQPGAKTPPSDYIVALASLIGVVQALVTTLYIQRTVRRLS